MEKKVSFFRTLHITFRKGFILNIDYAIGERIWCFIINLWFIEIEISSMGWQTTERYWLRFGSWEWPENTYMKESIARRKKEKENPLDDYFSGVKVNTSGKYDELSKHIKKTVPIDAANARKEINKCFEKKV